jgi:hypothetical protein
MADVTVIIPASRAFTLEECLVHLKRSVGVTYRLIVVLANRDPALRKLAQGAGAEIIEHYAKGDQHKARAIALASVTTEFVHFLDDDDFICPEFLRDGVALLRDDSTCGVAFSLPFKSVGVRNVLIGPHFQAGFVNPSCTIYRTKMIREVFAMLPEPVLSSSEDKLYTLVLASIFRAKFRCFRAPVVRGSFVENRKVWDTLMSKSLYDFWYRILLLLPEYQDDAVADHYVRTVLAETRQWYTRCVTYSLPVSIDIMKIRGSFGYQHLEPWPNQHQC